MAKKDSKKDLQKQVENTLTESFPEIRSTVGDKKFFKKVKKAAKILASGAVAAKSKPAPKAKAASKTEAGSKKKTADKKVKAAADGTEKATS